MYPHFFVWIKPANVIQVIGQLLNLHDVGRSQVGFQKNEEFPQVLEVTGQFSAITNCLNIFYIKPSNITQVVGQFDNLSEISEKLLTQPKTDQWPANIRQVE